MRHSGCYGNHQSSVWLQSLEMRRRFCQSQERVISALVMPGRISPHLYLQQLRVAGHGQMCESHSPVPCSMSLSMCGLP